MHYPRLRSNQRYKAEPPASRMNRPTAYLHPSSSNQYHLIHNAASILVSKRKPGSCCPSGLGRNEQRDAKSLSLHHKIQKLRDSDGDEALPAIGCPAAKAGSRMAQGRLYPPRYRCFVQLDSRDTGLHGPCAAQVYDDGRAENIVR